MRGVPGWARTKLTSETVDEHGAMAAVTQAVDRGNEDSIAQMHSLLTQIANDWRPQAGADSHALDTNPSQPTQDHDSDVLAAGKRLFSNAKSRLVRHPRAPLPERRSPHAARPTPCPGQLNDDEDPRGSSRYSGSRERLSPRKGSPEMALLAACRLVLASDAHPISVGCPDVPGPVGRDWDAPAKDRGGRCTRESSPG